MNPKTSSEALWLSAEHWLDVFENPLEERIGAEACPCCKFSDNAAEKAFGPNFINRDDFTEFACFQCPISRDYEPLCYQTPYYNALQEITALKSSARRLEHFDNWLENNFRSDQIQERIVTELEIFESRLIRAKKAIRAEYEFLVEMALTESQKA